MHLPESVRHVLLECPLYDRFRFDLYQELSFYGVVPSFSLILGHVENVDLELRLRVLAVTGLFLMRIARLRDC